jgi:hypothetical protein
MSGLIITTFLGAIVSLGCGGSSTSPTEVQLGQVFELRAGASATLQDGLKVTFDGVRSDSRCPMDALCVWAGDAVVAVRLSHAAGSPAERELHTAERSGSETSYLAPTWSSWWRSRRTRDWIDKFARTTTSRLSPSQRRNHHDIAC